MASPAHGSTHPGAAAAAANAAARNAAADRDADLDDHDPSSSSVVSVGLTGSIGMGKSSVSRMLAALSVPVLDADAVVHKLYSPGGAAVAPVAAAFGEAALDPDTGAVCRQRLSRLLLLPPPSAASGASSNNPISSNNDGMKTLEQIVHPLVAAERRAFLRACALRGEPVAALDVPLLFETGGDALVDAVAVVSAPPDEQRRRVLARPGMTPEKFEAILARQVADEEKRRRAHFVIDTGAAVSVTERAVAAMVALLRQGEARRIGGAAGGGEAEALVVVREWRLEEVRAAQRAGRRGGGGQ
jgi:dephospho-CoA kinase